MSYFIYFSDKISNNEGRTKRGGAGVESQILKSKLKKWIWWTWFYQALYVIYPSSEINHWKRLMSITLQYNVYI